ncbi:RNase H domain protein [Drepanopeziza brunnea f. sp. 'multigermtubi' MB_m1]|uniref:ribonuclease H n=1 Tax=Marssonina brunnea f. sp. multigermtubi (strain MB_m1) TaxID=1072389 RepID=K1WX18_MARBU|nr:RNase H domain protein [Drepanopeziza brunnea f. sp. 'multigermtubi' MB_m1]EKD13233.1 RNase H domain protein [Drepanopeziza brunnea f. sp. 'multigermtubi' MB_m1]
MSIIDPSLFEPPRDSDMPQQVFENEYRYIRKSYPHEILIYTDGACQNNGQNNPQANCAFVFRPSAYSPNDKRSYRLAYQHKSNRAKLRAVIAALQFRDWDTDCNVGWRSVVIATDSEYVAINATDRIRRWETSGWETYDWRLSCRVAIKNQDLWKLLLVEIRRLQSKGVHVSFWMIPREWNEMANKYAKVAVGLQASESFFRHRALGHRVRPRAVEA